MAGVVLSPSAVVARWTPTGAVSSSSLTGLTLSSTVLGAWRWDARGQISLTLPVELRTRAAAGLSTWGAGVGDVRLLATWETQVETTPSAGQRARPVAVVIGGLRLSTGRSAEASSDPFEADVTGSGTTGLVAQLQVERLGDRVPWWVALGTDVGVGSGSVQPALEASAGVGRTWGDVGSLTVTASHRTTWREQPDAAWATTSSTSLALVGSLTVAPTARLWLAARSGLPIPGLGSNALLEVGGSVGLTVGVPVRPTIGTARREPPAAAIGCTASLGSRCARHDGG